MRRKKIETDRGVGRCASRKKLEEVDRSGKSGNKRVIMKILDYISQLGVRRVNYSTKYLVGHLGGEERDMLAEDLFPRDVEPAHLVALPGYVHVPSQVTGKRDSKW